MKSLCSLTSAIVTSNFAKKPRPYKLTLAATYRCNSRCQLCNIWQKPPQEELSLGQLTKFFSRNQFNWIDITGGEIFLRKDIADLLSIVIQHQPNLYLLHMPTNGLLSETIFSSIRQVLTDNPHRCIVTVSLDGPEKIHDKLRGIKGGWKRAIKTYRMLSSLNSPSFHCYFGMTVSRYNAAYLEETFSELRKEIPSLKRTDMHFNLAHISSHYYGNDKLKLDINNDIASVIPAFTEKNTFSFDAITHIEHLYQQSIPTYLQTHQCPFPCKALISSVFVNPYGIVFPCSMWNYPLGDIQKTSYRLGPLLNRQKTRSALQKISKQKCPQCWTPCEAYQTIFGNVPKSLLLK